MDFLSVTPSVGEKIIKNLNLNLIKLLLVLYQQLP